VPAHRDGVEYQVHEDGKVWRVTWESGTTDYKFEEAEPGVPIDADTIMAVGGGQISAGRGPSRAQAERMLPWIKMAMLEANINTPQRAAAFLAEVIAETDLTNLEELKPDAARIEGGLPYKGRGPIQLTRESNYARAGQYLGIDLVNNADLVSTDLEVGFKVAAWYWNHKTVIDGREVDLNTLADDGDIAEITRLVWGSTAPEGLDLRRELYIRALDALTH